MWKARTSHLLMRLSKDNYWSTYRRQSINARRKYEHALKNDQLKKYIMPISAGFILNKYHVKHYVMWDIKHIMEQSKQ